MFSCKQNEAATTPRFRLWALRGSTVAAHRFDVAMEDPVAVHVVHSLGQRIHELSYPRLAEVVTPTADELVDIHLHQLEYERQPPSGLIVEDLDQLDDVRMW